MDTKLAYLAGFFDGEGCVSIGRSSGGYYSLMVAVGQLDPAPLELFRARFGGYFAVKRKDGYRPVFQWRSAGQQAADALRVLEPFLLVKRDQAVLAVKFQVHMTTRLEHSPRGVAQGQREREQMYLDLKAMKARTFDEPVLEERRRGPRKGLVGVRLSDGTGHPNPRRGLVEDPGRLAAMHAMRRDGKTYEAIGADFGIKKAAVHQILKRWPDG